MSSSMFCISVLVFLFAPVQSDNNRLTSSTVAATAFFDSLGNLQMTEGVNRSGAAWATFSDEIDTTGWAELNVKAGYGTEKCSDDSLMYAAGYLEGALSTKRIYQHYENSLPTVIPSKEVELKIRQWLQEQEDWMVEMIKTNGEDPFWRQIGLVYAQFEGLVKGYQTHCPEEEMLDRFYIQAISAFGDLFDLPAIVDRVYSVNLDEMTQDDVEKRMTRSHCSAIIKVLPGYEDVLAGHSSWFDYAILLRVYKHYDFNLVEPSTASKGVSFSSYPGCLVSIDDFYLLSSEMIMLQTTNSIWNTSLYDVVTPKSLLAWQRVRVANAMATSSKSWTDLVKIHNSGTYNNQYMVLDLKKIKLRQTIEDGALYVAEQIPGLVVSGDVTPLLREGHWVSYNVPYWKEIYDLSGYVQVVKKFGTGHSYQLAPRAEIFRRDADKVTDISSLKSLLRYNNYKNEEYADGNACHSICCRNDLNKLPTPFGCFDTKVTNFTMALSREAEGISGPTTEGGLPPFSWNQFENVNHFGMPIVWDFEFIFLSPSSDSNQTNT